MDLLTPTGRALAGLAVALVGIGALAGYAGIVGLGLAIGALVAAGWRSVRRASDLEVTRSVLPERARRGQVARVHIALKNRQSMATRLLALIDRRDLYGDITLSVGAIGGGESVELDYEIECTHRGRLQIGPLLVRQADPFGVARSDATAGAPTHLWVYPATYPIDVLPQGRVKELEEPASDTAPNGSASFHQLREYVPGKDVRHIHWRTTGRTGSLMVKHLVDTTKPEIALLVDNRADVIGERDFEEAVEVAASLVAAATAGRYPVYLAFSAPTETARELHAAPVLDRLATIERGQSTGLVAAAHEIGHHCGPILVVVTGELSAADRQAIAKLALGFSTTVIVSTVSERSGPFLVPPHCWSLAVPDARTFAQRWQGR